MPGFMDKRSIAGNGSDFASRLLEDFIFKSKVFQFRRAYKENVRQIEEESLFG